MCKIIYVDMDCFFVVVEMCDNFVLCDIFIVIGGSCECWGVISIVNYFVCKFGVCSVMLIGMVFKLCLYFILFLGCFDVYKEVLNYICEIFLCYILCIELLLLDEVYFDVIDSVYCYGFVIFIVQEICQMIFNEL